VVVETSWSDAGDVLGFEPSLGLRFPAFAGYTVGSRGDFDVD